MRSYCDDVGEIVLWAATGRRFDSCTIIGRPLIGRLRNTVLDAIRGDYGYFGAIDPEIPCSEFPVDQYEFEIDPRIAELEMPVQSVTTVTVDGALIPAASYRLDDGYKLVRTDGDTWPLWQDITLDASASGTFVVTYVVGLPIPSALLAAAGSYALELARGLSPDTVCRLPSVATTIAREGVTIEMIDPATLLQNGLTGIPDVDALVKAFNPSALSSPLGVYVPGRKTVRTSA